MVEWFKAHAWKACELRGSAGSNPVLCANRKKYELNVRIFCYNYFGIHMYYVKIKKIEV